MAASNLDVIKDVPGYKVILKAVLKTQIQQLVEQLATHTDEESVILTASVADGTLSHLGSDSGKSFLVDNEDVKSQFLGFCLKKHHRKKIEEKEKEQERERQLEQEHMQAAAQLSMPGLHGGPRRGGPMGRAMFPRHSTPRHSPYSVPPRPAFDRRPSGDYSSMGQEDSSQQQQQQMGLKQENTEQLTGEFSDPEQSNSSSSTLPVESGGANIQMGGDHSEGINVKTEVNDSELDLEITGVEVGLPGVGQDDWSAANTSMGMGFDAGGGATGSQADMSGGQQAYNSSLSASPLEQCHICKKYYKTRMSLKRHLQSHRRKESAESNTVCRVCGQYFPNSRAVKSHVREMHRETVKMYQCGVCNKSSTTRQNLEVHMRTHTGEKPFQCDQCSRTFSQSSAMRSHRMTHFKFTSLLWSD